MQAFLLFSKAVLVVFYTLIPIAFLTSFLAEYRYYMLIGLAVLVIAHLAEYVLLKNRMEAIQPDRKDHLVQTLLFGYGHWLGFLRAK